MWIIEDNMYGYWTKLTTFRSEQAAQVALARYALSPQFSQYQFRIVHKPNITEG